MRVAIISGIGDGSSGSGGTNDGQDFIETQHQVGSDCSTLPSPLGTRDFQEGNVRLHEDTTRYTQKELSASCSDYSHAVYLHDSRFHKTVRADEPTAS